MGGGANGERPGRAGGKGGQLMYGQERGVRALKLRETVLRKREGLERDETKRRGEVGGGRRGRELCINGG